MGIRNQRSSGPTTPSTRAHYPSWGSETLFDIQDKITAKLANSLPLMGIRNSRERLDARAVVRGLTTPHGDQKRWIIPRCQLHRFEYSLPLMGIRNFEPSR